MLEGFFATYVDCLQRSDVADEQAEFVELLDFYAGEFEQQLVEPFAFKPFHEAVTEPHDYYALNKRFMRPLVDTADSRLVGEENFRKMQAQLAAGENVVLLSNHQTEADPSAFTALLDPLDDGKFAYDMVHVAGDRVTTDPVAVPFSKGRNLLCIYSKRHMNNPPELASKKKMHNARVMGALQKMLQTGGRTIWVAPSGGRDRPSTAPDARPGEFAVAPFDPKSVEMFRLMASKAKATPTHFYPVAMLTHRLIPPPAKVESGGVDQGGEKREARRASVAVCLGDELDLDDFEQGCLVSYEDGGGFPEGCVNDREATRVLVTEHIHKTVKANYDLLVADAAARGSPYYTEGA